MQTYFKRRNKYGAIRQTYGGYSYMSKKEATYAALLDSMKKAHDKRDRVVSYQRQIKVPMVVNGKLICNYYCDFLVTFADRRKEYHEVKGYTTDIFRIKEKLFRALYPKETLIVIR